MWALALLGLIGAGISAYGQYQQGQESKQASMYNASVMEQEASMARAGAERENEITRQNAVLNEYRQRKQMAYSIGSQVGGYAKSGVSVSTGSPLDVMADSISNAELEIQMGQWNAKNEMAMNTYNTEIGARNRESSAKLQRMYGISNAKNANYQAVGTLLSSGSKYGSALGNEKVPSSGATTIGGSPSYSNTGNYSQYTSFTNPYR